MKKFLVTILAALMLLTMLSTPVTALADAQTFLGTPRSETLIIEADAGQYKNPGIPTRRC